jgi:hypothetical protein
MRFASTTFLVAMVLFIGGATSALGGWAVAVACPLFLTAAIAGAVAMEDHDLAPAEGLLPSAAAPATEATVEAAPPLLDAA